MAATVQINEYNTVSETETTGVSNWNYGATDAANLTPASYPIRVTEHSFTKYWKLNVTNMGGSNKIDNIQIWKSAGAYGTDEGIQCSLRTSGYSQPAFATPTQTVYTDQTMPVADPTTANLGIGGSLSGSITVAGMSDRMKSQLQTGAGTPVGNVAQKTFTIQYDEQ